MASKKKSETGAPAAGTGAKAIFIPPLDKRRFDLWVVGETPLIVHAWSKHARDEMLRKQMGMPTRKKAPKNPQQQLDSSFYHTDDGRYGIHAAAVKQAAVGACRHVDAKMTEARGMFFVLGGVIPIYGSDPEPREDMVRIAGGTADIRYRPMFKEWALKLEIEYDASVTSPEQLGNLINRAGMAPGIGEWRPERNGDYGRFRIANEKEIALYSKRIPAVGKCKVQVELDDYVVADAAE